jgi:hypothetical protein
MRGGKHPIQEVPVKWASFDFFDCPEISNVPGRSTPALCFSRMYMKFNRKSAGFVRDDAAADSI